jgi:hypothetical protein
MRPPTISLDNCLLKVVHWCIIAAVQYTRVPGDTAVPIIMIIIIIIWLLLLLLLLSLF